jgi:hypothetical protein
MGDFLERDICFFDDRAVDAQVLVAVISSVPVGWVRYSARRFFKYVDGHRVARMRPAAVVNFPVTSSLRPDVWLKLYDAVLGSLFEIGIGWSATYLPRDAHGPAEFLDSIGYESLGSGISPSDPFGVQEIYLRKCTAARGFIRPDLTPEYAKAPLLDTAAAATAPRPERASWESQLAYSGYSGYPWITTFLKNVLEPRSTLLSVPCGTGDIFRLMPVSMIQEFRRGVGVDLLKRNTDFAEQRLVDPNIDLLNMALNSFFWAAGKGIWQPDEAREIFNDIAGLAGRLMLSDESSDYFSQIQSIHHEAVQGGAITDWFAATKALATLLTCSPTPSIVHTSGRTAPEIFARCSDVASQYGRPIFNYLSTTIFPRSYFVEEETRAAGLHRIQSRTEFTNENMFTMELNERFDIVLVWEATLMTAAVGRETEFVENLLRHVKRNGCLLLTGIRADDGRVGQELMNAGAALAKAGCEVSYGSMRPRATSWAATFVDTPRFPYLAAIPTREV